MKVRLVNLENDYSDLTSWWTTYCWTPVSEAMLPKTGLMVEDKEKIVSGFLYRTDSSICLLEWVVGNPALSKEERKNGMNLLFSTSKLWAKAHGFKIILTMTKNNGLINSLTNNEFKKTDGDMSHFMFMEGM